MPPASLWGDEDVTVGDLVLWGDTGGPDTMGSGFHQGTQKCGVALGDLALQGVGWHWGTQNCG